MRISDWSSDVCSSDLHVENAAAGRPAASREWIDRTWPQLEAAGITRADLQTITKQIVPMIHYNWGGTEVLVSHGGFTKFPTSLHLIPDAILRRGNGHYGTSLDAMWSDSEQARFDADPLRSEEEHTSELKSLMRISYAVFCLQTKKQTEPLTTP